MEIWYFSKDEFRNFEPIGQLQLPADQGFIWIDADQSEVDAVIARIQPLLGFTINESHLEDCKNLQHPSFYESTQLYDIFIFRSLIAKEDAATSSTETAPIAFLVFPKILITFNHHDLAIDRIKARFTQTRKKPPEDPSMLLFIILDEVVDNFLLLKAPLLERYYTWQRNLFNTCVREIDWLKFLNFKTALRSLRVLSEDQQDVIYQWRQDNLMMGEQLTIRYNDVSEHIKRIIRYTTQLENDLETLLQLHYSLTGHRTNNAMRVLTVLSAIFLPLNLIAGVFGMNFVHMSIYQKPYGPELAFWGMAVLGVILYLSFKWKEWI